MHLNRKKLPAAIRVWPVIWMVSSCVALGLIGLGYVAQKGQIYALGVRYRELDLRLDRLRRENAARVSLLDTLRTPGELEARVKRMNLGLVLPQPRQVVLLHEQVNQELAWRRPLYAGKKDSAITSP